MYKVITDIIEKQFDSKEENFNFPNLIKFRAYTKIIEVMKKFITNFSTSLMKLSNDWARTDVFKEIT